MNASNPGENEASKDVSEPSRHLRGYLGLTALFFLLSFFTLYVVHRKLSGGGLHFKPGLLTLRTVVSVVSLLGFYFLADGLRLYHVIRAMGFKVRFGRIMKPVSYTHLTLPTIY